MKKYLVVGTYNLLNYSLSVNAYEVEKEDKNSCELGLVRVDERNTHQLKIEEYYETNSPIKDFVKQYHEHYSHKVALHLQARAYKLLKPYRVDN